MHFDRGFLIRLMDEHFFTYEDLGERIGVSKTSVYRWVSGRSEPSKRNIRKIAEVFGIEPMQLMTEDEGYAITPSKYGR